MYAMSFSKWSVGVFAVLLVMFILWSLYGIGIFYWRRRRNDKRAKVKISKEEIIKNWEAKYRKVDRR